jgi:solute:Na+ symporter, SSS family
LSIALSAVIENMYPAFPFLNRMGVVFWICSAVHVAISLAQSKGKNQANAFEVRSEWFKVTPIFRYGALAVIVLFSLIYWIFW